MSTRIIYEYDEFTIPFLYDGLVVSAIFSVDPSFVVAQGSTQDYLDGDVKVIVAGNTVTVSGKFNKEFTRSINYLDNTNTLTTVPYFADIPPEYNAVTKYTGPYILFKPKLLNVIYLDSITFLPIPMVEEIDVYNNWMVSNAALTAAVTKGAV